MDQIIITLRTVLSVNAAKSSGLPTLQISAPRFFFSGVISKIVFKDKPKTISELKESITKQIKAIKRPVLKRVFALRMQKCRNLNGSHLEHLL